MVDRFIIGKEIGSGAHGTVFLAERKADGLKGVLKKFVTPTSSYKHEIAVLEQVRPHGNIVKMYEHFVDMDARYIFLEHIDGKDLFDNRPTKLALIKNYIRQIIHALKHLHKNHVVYVDLKPENLVANKGNIKLIKLNG